MVNRWETDPDCRFNTIKAFNVAINLAMDCEFDIVTPLMYLTKAESIKMAQQYGAMEALGKTTTCYEGTVPPCSYTGCVTYEETLDKGCPACKLRNKGFIEAGLIDPLWKRTHKVVKM